MKPVLLCVPGMLNDAEIWSAVKALLRDAAELRVVDVLGVQDIAQAAGQAWDLLGPDTEGRPLVLAGFSMGGYIVQSMLVQPRRALHAAALVSTSARPDSDEARANRQKTARAFERDFARAVEGLLPYNLHQQEPALLDQARAMMLRVGPEVAIRQLQAIAVRPDVRPALAGCAMPVRVICGREDRITPLALSEELAALLPQARLCPVDHCGHLMPLEQPAVLAEHLRALLA